MKKFFSLFFMLLISSVLFAQQRGFVPIEVSVSGQKTVLYKQSHALVIGNINYTNGWGVLPGVANDVERVKTALENNGFNVIVKNNLTKMQMITEIDNFLTQYGYEKENRVLIYYAGHGHTLNNNNSLMGYIVPIDAPMPNTNQQGFLAKALPMTQFKTWSESSTFSKHSLFMFDACFAGSIFTSRGAPTANEVINYNTTNFVRQFIASGSANETVPDQSVFCTQFVYALESGAADFNNDGYMTGTEMGEYLKNTVIQYRQNAQHPQYGKLDNPNFDKGDFVFEVVNRSIPPVTPTLGDATNTGSNTPITPTLGSAESTIRYGTIEITTEITGDLYMDGTLMGSVKAFDKHPINSVVVGSRTLEIRNAQETWRQAVTVAENQTARITAKSTLTYGTVEVTTQLSGELWIDGVKIGNISANTKVPINKVLSGSRKIELRNSSEPWNGTVTVQANQTATVTITARTPIVNPNNQTAAAEVSGPNGMVFRRIEGGTFTMGSPASEVNHESDETQHQVTLSPYYMSKYEVTQAQWKAVMGSNPSSFSGCDNCPVESVSWNDIQTFIQKLNAQSGQTYRLPTEAEWEYAAGGGANNRSKWAGTNNESDLGTYAWFTSNSGYKTHPVGQKQPNSLGLYDMSGNVWEWCSDWYGTYPSGSQTNPTGAATGSSRVSRGGSWSNSAQYCRSAYRNYDTPDRRSGGLGFRLVLAP